MKQKIPPLPVRLAAIVCGVSLLLMPASPVLAKLGKAERSRAEAKAMEAKIEFKSGNHDKAAQLFLEAFAISRAPALMYNAARAYQQGDMPNKAIIVFEQYLELDGVSRSGQAEAKGHLQTLRKQVAAASSKPEPTVKPAPAPTPKPDPEPKATTKPAPNPTPTGGDKPGDAAVTPPVGVVAPTPAPDRGKWVTWGLLGGGGLLFIIGAASMSGASGELDEANAMDFSVKDAKKTYNERADSAESQHNAGIFFTLVGLGLGGWGAWRMWMAPSTTTAAPPASAWFARPELGQTWDGQAQYGLTVGGHFQ